jgi:hypothetical protein
MRQEFRAAMVLRSPDCLRPCQMLQGLAETSPSKDGSASKPQRPNHNLPLKWFEATSLPSRRWAGYIIAMSVEPREIGRRRALNLIF